MLLKRSKYDNNKRIIKTVEKDVVSDSAIAGIYSFKSAEFFPVTPVIDT